MPGERKIVSPQKSRCKWIFFVKEIPGIEIYFHFIITN